MIMSSITLREMNSILSLPVGKKTSRSMELSHLTTQYFVKRELKNECDTSIGAIHRFRHMLGSKRTVALRDKLWGGIETFQNIVYNNSFRI